MQGLNSPDWQIWIDRFPEFQITDQKRFSGWRRRIELAASFSFPSQRLSPIDRAVILAALTRHADRLQDRASPASALTVTLSSISLAAGIASFLVHALTPAAVVLATLALGKRTWDTGLGGNAGNKAVHDLLADVAGRLP